MISVKYLESKNLYRVKKVIKLTNGVSIMVNDKPGYINTKVTKDAISISVLCEESNICESIETVKNNLTLGKLKKG